MTDTTLFIYEAVAAKMNALIELPLSDTLNRQ